MPIRFANNILDGIGNTPLSQQEYNNLTGETRFSTCIRLFMLARNWGAVPFFDEQNMNDFNKPRTPEADIWKFVIDEPIMLHPICRKWLKLPDVLRVMPHWH